MIDRCPAEFNDCVFRELSSVLFESLSRKDQRARGTDYLRGLLGAHGRRTIRNIAAIFGDPAAQQGLHHFISNSTWEWSPVRHALARFLVERLRPAAWVVEPMIIPKWGVTAIGVDRLYSPESGQVVNAQQAIGVWAVTEWLSSPVNWRLQLSSAWLEEAVRRRAGIPEGVAGRSLGECAVEAAVETGSEWGLLDLPVIVDARQVDVSFMIGSLRRAGVPFLARVRDDLPLVPGVPGSATGYAGQLMRGAWDRVRPVVRRSQQGAIAGVELAAVVTGVGMVPAGGCDGSVVEVSLLGVGESREQWPGELWLTDMVSAPVVALARLSALPRRIDQDCREGAGRLGIRDFGGRTYGAWHRHVTLVSAAHAVLTLQERPGRWHADCCNR
ncbi:transposase [Streptomyces sp. NBC_01077]|uniref:IS701 family transposase n=1 Tax=Streptomyces sp. NBC_01077 TaxID=2903746 RepID=UPI00386963DF|nr:transposase [Streptomyces sp. NBC_01077]WSV43592.1 transposase [Streptomyces sp. NBC_01077]